MHSLIDIGRYTLEQPLGRGGEGEVWSGTRKADGSRVAVKILGKARMRDRPAWARLLLEIRAAASLNHPHVVQILDHGVTPRDVSVLTADAPFVVMELARGGHLSSQRALLDWPRLEACILQVLDALAAAHAIGLIHRDVKPGNILVAASIERPDVRLSDFGLAGWREDGGGWRAHAAGTPSYMPPEQLRGDARAIGPWTDLFALGCMVWSLVGGAFPSGDSRTQDLLVSRYQPLPPLVPRFPVPEGLEAVLAGLLEPVHTNRTRFAADAAAAIRSLGPPVAQRQEDPLPELQARFMDEDTVGWEGGAAHPSTSERRPRAALPSRCPPFATALQRKARPIRAARRVVAGLRELPVAGRSDVLQAAWRALERMYQTGTFEALVLTGPSGMGKSRLAEWIASRAHELGAAAVLRVQHSALGGPRTGTLPALRRALGTSGMSVQDIEDVLALEIPALEDDDRTQLSRLLEGGRPIESGGSRGRHRLMLRTFTALTEQRPLIVILDDITASPDAVALVREALREPPEAPVLLVLTVGGTHPELPRDITGSPTVRSQHLGPLSLVPATRLVMDALDVDEDLAEQIARRSGGVPVVLVQTIRDLVQQGLSDAAPTAAQLPADPDAVWQGGLQRVIGDHGSAARVSMELAAALGGASEPGEWERACERAGVSSNRYLTESLFREGLARSPGLHRTEANGWEFAHGSLRDHIRDRARREGTWGERAAVCAQVVRDASDGQVSIRLGRLLAEAGQDAAAVDEMQAASTRLLLVGEAAVARDALLETSLLIARAALKGPVVPRNHTLLAEACCNMGDLAGAEEAARCALEEAAASADRMLVAAAWRELGRIAWWRGDSEVAVQKLASACAQARQAGAQAEHARWTIDRANALLPLGRLDEAEQILEPALRWYQQRGQPVGIARCRLLLGEIRRQQSRWAAGVTQLQHALEHLEGAGFHPLRARVVHNLGEVLRSAGSPSEAAPHYDEAEGWFARLGDDNAAWFTRLNKALNDLQRGRPDLAESTMRAISALPEPRGLSVLQAMAEVALLGIVGTRGEVMAFSTHLSRLESLLSRTAFVDQDIVRYATAACAHVTGEPALLHRLQAIIDSQRARLPG